MSIISANTLFHFTRTQDTLLKILETGFKPAYSREFGYSTKERILESYIPMVCLCDLPLSNIEKHSRGYNWEYDGIQNSFKGYGKFGIGLSKEWGKKAKLNPVTYITNESYYLNFSLGLNSLSNSIVQDEKAWDTVRSLSPKELTNKKKTVDRKHIIESFRHGIQQMSTMAYSLFNYMKPYQDLSTGQRYYDEREWRFVIPISGYRDPNEFPSIMTKFSNDVDTQVKEHQSRIDADKNCRLLFSADDIKYIIVDGDENIKSVIKLMTSLPNKFKEKDIERLTSRILTSEQIHDDF